MTADDGLAARLAGHRPCKVSVKHIGFHCAAEGCAHVYLSTGDALPSHLADVALAWMAEHGCARGREEWGIRYERDADPTMDNPSGEMTSTMALRDEAAVRAAVKNNAPISARNRRVVRRRVTDWEEVK